VVKETLTAGGDDDGRRLDRILRKSFPATPLSALHRLLRKGAVTVNGKKAAAATRVSTGDVIEFTMEGGGGGRREQGTGNREDVSSLVFDTIGKPHRNNIDLQSENPFPVPRSPAAMQRSLSILFENDDVLALNKSVGVLVHGEGSLEGDVRGYLAGRIPQSLSFSPGPAHRLDRGTSGLILFSKSLDGARYISRGLREGIFCKTYLAIVEGKITGEEFWEDALLRDRQAKKTIVGQGEGLCKAKSALTRVKALAHTERLTLVEARIETGRTHQIRAQAAARGHPLVHDRKYGGTGSASGIGGKTFYLHSHCIEFPVDNPLHLAPRITAPLPPAFQRMIDTFFMEQ
jgi:23S rRNA pseudouridine955/2504/2580 synthase